MLLLPSLAAMAVLYWATNQTINAAGVGKVLVALSLASQLLWWADLSTDPSSAQVNPQETATRSDTQLLQQQQQQQQQPGRAAPQHQSSACDSEESLSDGCQQDTMQWWMTCELLEQALGLISTLIQKVWVLLTAGEAAAAAAAGAAAGGGGSSGTTSGDSATPCLRGTVHGAAHTATLWDLESVMLQLQPHADELHIAELLACRGNGSQDIQQPISSSKAWAKHMPLLLRPFEALVRTLAHHPRASGRTADSGMFAQPLEVFIGPDALMAAYWRHPGASRDLDPQLISTCFSMLKALEVCRRVTSNVVAAEDEAAKRSQVVLRFCLISFEAVGNSSGFKLACAGSPADGTPLWPSSSSSSSDSSSEAVSLLPWLVLLGRCCLHWALELQQSTAACWAESESHNSLVVCLKAFQEACLGWMQDDHIAAELAAAGYATQRVVAALQAPTVPARAEDRSAAGSEDSTSAANSDADVVTLAQQLHALGLALSTLAISCACNNPYCSSLEGLSELELVQGRARQCAKCRTARYCSKECQAQHWKLHKPACKALEAARQAQSSA